MPGRAGFQRWLVTFVLVALPSLLWVVASPLSSGPDEPAHIIRAVSVAQGEVLGQPLAGEPDGPTTIVRIPSGVADLPQPACYTSKPEVPASCFAGTLGDTGGTPLAGGDVAARTTSGRHQPFYYGLAGIPLAIDQTGPEGTYLARGLSALVCAAFLASALVLAGGAPRPALAVLGTLAAMTPMAVYLTGVVNPNALEAAAAACLWVALLRLARAPGAPAVLPRGAVHAAGLAGVVMTLTRPVSALWLGIAVAVAAVVARPEALSGLLRSRSAWAWAGVGALTAGASAAWLVVVGNPILVFPPEQPLPYGAALQVTLDRTALNVEQLIGQFGWLDVRLPAPVLWTWMAVTGVVVLAAVAARRWWRATVVLGLVAATVVVPAAIEALRYNDLGIVWQGRYTLPLAMGVPILAGLTAADARHPLRRLEAVAGPLVLVLGAVHVIGFTVALRRYTVGINSAQDFLNAADWVAPLPALVLLLSFLLAEGGLIASLVWWWPVQGEATDQDSEACRRDPVAEEAASATLAAR